MVRYPIEHATDLPSASEMRQLLHLVLNRYPQLAEDNAIENFATVSKWLGAVARGPGKLVAKYYPAYWLDQCEHWADDRGTIRLRTFISCAIAHSVPYGKLEAASYVHLGLDYAGKPVAGGWRRVLEAGRVPDPSE
jgi:hypothetical protein